MILSLAGLFVGATIGALGMSLCVMARRSDHD